jgi:FdhD protein
VAPEKAVSDRVAIAAVRRHGAGPPRADQDLVAVEAPLAVRVTHPSRPGARPLGLLMRTPGDDRELVLGLLFSEGIIGAASDVAGWTWADERGDEPAAVDVALGAQCDYDDTTGARGLTATSACGLCGRLALTRVDTLGPGGRDRHATPLTTAVVRTIPDQLRARQAVFAETGGLHAAATFDPSGGLTALREDVGRHNAVDKLVGALLEAGAIPARDATLGVSGRVAFEIAHKAVHAGVRAIVAIGAPSSLAVDACRAGGVTLVGFARDGKFNVYSGEVQD